MYIEHIAHDKCGSSDGLAVYGSDSDNINGYCWACGEYVPDPYKDKPATALPLKKQKDPEEIAKELEEISSYPTVPLPSRKLRVEALEYFGVKIGLSEFDGKTPMFRYLPFRKDGVISGYKVKVIAEKKMWSVGDLKGVEPFGWREALGSGTRKLFITEGEEDAIALFQALKDKEKGSKWESINPAVVSLPHGSSGAKKFATEHQSTIRKNWREVVLVFDMDEQGKKAAREFCSVIPTARTVDLPAKDANDCVIQGRSKALASAVLFNSEVPKNTRIVWIDDLIEDAKEAPQMGLSWPWQGLTEMTRGIRFGETYYIGAGVKMGKSEVVNTLAVHLAREHGLKVFLAKPEEANKKSTKLLLGKVAGKFFHDPTKEFDGDAYDQAAPSLRGKIALLNLYQRLGWDHLRGDIISAVGQGCKAVFIDPITNLTNGISSGEANTQLQEIAQELSAMAMDHDFAAFIFCHLKAPESGDPHERGGKVLSHQFAGSRAMMRSCNYMLGIEGNKDPDIPEDDRNIRRLVVLEDREFGSSGSIHLYWNKDTGLFTELRD